MVRLCLIANRIQGNELTGMLYGGLVGITYGVIYLYKSHKRMNGILNQIRVQNTQ